MLRAGREGAAGTAPAPARRPCCSALLLLAVCASATAVPCGRAALPAVPCAAPGSSASRRGPADTLGTRTAATGTSRTSLQQQPGCGDREGLRLGTAGAVTLCPARWPGKRVPAASAGLSQPEGVPSPGSWCSLARRGLHRAAPGSRGGTLMAAVAAAGGLGQPVGTAEPPSPERGSEATSRAGSEPAAGLPATSQLWLHPPALPMAAAGPSAGAAVAQVAPNQPVPLPGVAVGSRLPPGVPAWAPMGAGSWSPSTAEQVVASAVPAQGTPSRAQLSPGMVGVPPALAPEGLGGTAGTALPGAAAPLGDAVLAQLPGNGSGLLDALLASLPATAAAPGAHSQHLLASSLPTVTSGAPAVTLGTQSEWPFGPAQPVPTGASPVQPRAPSPAGPSVPGLSPTAPGVTPELGQTFVTEGSRHSQPRPASVGAVSSPAAPPGPSPASPGSVPPPCSPEPALQRGSEPGHRIAPSSSVPSPSCLPASPAAGHAASSLLSSPSLPVPTAGPLHALAVSRGSSPSQHSCTATEQLPAASRVASSPAEQMPRGRPGSTGMECPACHPCSLPLPTQPVHVLPLQFRLLGMAFCPALGSRDSESYRQLERDVTLLLNQMLSSYKSFLQANVLEFLNGSVVVRGEVLFRGDAPAPTNSHLIRTVVTEASKGRSMFSWQLEPQSVLSGGFSLENLEPEKLSISLAGPQLGMGRMDPLERLAGEVTAAVSALYDVRNFTISQLRNLGENTEVTGDLYLDTVVHADLMEVLEALAALSGLSMGLSSLSVEGSRLALHVYPLSLLVTNRHFRQELQDPLSAEHHELSRDLGDAVVGALRDYPSFLTAIIKEFLPGSLICHGQLIFRPPAPPSVEVLKTLVRSVGPDQALAGSDFHVDPHSLSVGEDTLEPATPQPGSPASGVSLVAIGGLCIVVVPVVLVCLGTKRLAGRALRDRRDPQVGIQTLEMENQGFWTEGP
ncbi:nascent polypeptide-associated complex subunit alpha, muscle-specific form-like isoform X5 [Passer montanus]|uniref:nascent polypeptide-associated complex subunit alpha, muscle-specific form-like isoform X5 n=1 Tax=Passer montanus TaxID=9160 RepID=UPI001960C402|nr:nascent polypeptide-associated complex subunit alpha, muscle-specific form-like isoform X5 [Passer montanus]